MSKEDRGILVTADIGSFNIKLSTGGVYENRFKLNNKDDIIGHDAIEIDGNTYFFNEGSFDRNIIKPHKDLITPLLYALGKDGVSGVINTILHLPPNQMPMKAELVEKLEGKTFEYKLNGQGTSITFKKVGVLKEGFSSFYSLPKRTEGLIAIVNIGGRTTEVLTFNNGTLEYEKSFPIGTMDYFDKIADELTGKGTPRVMEDIKKLLDNNVIDIADFEEITQDVYSDMINMLQQDFPNISDYNIKLCGGGAVFFEDNFKANYKKVQVLSNNLTSEVEGAARIGKAKGLDK